jgi:hypothetical protein
MPGTRRFCHSCHSFSAIHVCHSGHSMPSFMTNPDDNHSPPPLHRPSTSIWGWFFHLGLQLPFRHRVLLQLSLVPLLCPIDGLSQACFHEGRPSTWFENPTSWRCTLRCSFPPEPRPKLPIISPFKVQSKPPGSFAERNMGQAKTAYIPL